MLYFEIKVNSITTGDPFTTINVDMSFINAEDKKLVQKIENISFVEGVLGEFVRRTTSHVFIEKQDITDDELKALWNLQINVYSASLYEPKASIFAKRLDTLKALGLLPNE